MCYIKQENMVEKRKKCSESTDEDPMPEHEIVKDTLGHRPGYVKGMGYGVTKARGQCSKTDKLRSKRSWQSWILLMNRLLSLPKRMRHRQHK